MSDFGSYSEGGVLPAPPDSSGQNVAVCLMRVWPSVAEGSQGWLCVTVQGNVAFLAPGFDLKAYMSTFASQPHPTLATYVSRDPGKASWSRPDYSSVIYFYPPWYCARGVWDPVSEKPTEKVGSHKSAVHISRLHGWTWWDVWSHLFLHKLLYALLSGISKQGTSFIMDQDLNWVSASWMIYAADFDWPAESLITSFGNANLMHMSMTSFKWMLVFICCAAPAQQDLILPAPSRPKTTSAGLLVLPRISAVEGWTVVGYQAVSIQKQGHPVGFLSHFSRPLLFWCRFPSSLPSSASPCIRLHSVQHMLVLTGPAGAG